MKLSPNKRIALNVVASYARSLYSLVFGLFTARWTLMALGQTDYGLYGVVGGLVMFVGFFNGLLSCAVGRFYAFSVGKASVAKEHHLGVEECRRWFSIATAIHTVLPTVLIIIGYPFGMWAVEHFLNIPPDRVDACCWVWRFTCLSCFVGMITIPHNAMYGAKQLIAELTIYSFATTTLNACFLFYIVNHDGDWLICYAAWVCILSVLPNLIICLRAHALFEECRFHLSYVCDKRRIMELFKFAGMNFVGAVSQLFSAQGIPIVVNKLMGPAMNAAMSIGNNINGQAANLSSALFGAFQPAIANAAGAKDMVRLHNLVFRTCSLGTLAFMIFAIPLFLEIDEILRLWLEQPPEGAASFCMFYLVVRVIDRISDGHWVAIFALGDIVAFRVVESITFWTMPILAVVLLWNGCGIAGVGFTFIICHTASSIIKLYYGRKKAGLGIRKWIKDVLVPIVFLLSITFIAGESVKLMLPATLLRVVLTTISCEAVLLPLSWFLILKAEDRIKILNKLRIGG